MSRTYKDKKWKLRFPESYYTFGTERVLYQVHVYRWSPEAQDDAWSTWSRCVYLPIAGAKTKKKRNSMQKWCWSARTPSAWTRSTMNRPKRRDCRVWERKVLFQDVEEADCPDYGRKPHIYYY